MRLLKAKRRLAGFGGVEFEWPTRYVGDPQRSLEFEAGKPFQVLGMPFPVFLDFWTATGFFTTASLK